MIRVESFDAFVERLHRHASLTRSRALAFGERASVRRLMVANISYFFFSLLSCHPCVIYFAITRCQFPSTYRRDVSSILRHLRSPLTSSCTLLRLCTSFRYPYSASISVPDTQHPYGKYNFIADTIPARVSSSIQRGRTVASLWICISLLSSRCGTRLPFRRFSRLLSARHNTRCIG